MSEPQPFSGFPEGTFRFLEGLAANNHREWFEAHRADYQQFYIEPALDFIVALGPRLQQISSAIRFKPRINGSLFRINRDIRFSRDKTPYKTNLDLWFWEGDRKGWDTPGFFFRMSADTLMIGAGMHQMDKRLLEAYREAVVDPKLGQALADAFREIEQAGPYQIGGATRKTVPRGFDPNHERSALLLHEGLWAGHEGPIPPEARSAAFVDYCATHYRALWPVSRWLGTLLSNIERGSS